MNESQPMIAIVGLDGRFPGANNVEEFWGNLCAGVESVVFYSDAELLEAGIDPALLRDPNYVKAGAPLEGKDLFDASFFGYSPREAEIIDPQQRLFLECAWHALENAGYDPEKFAGRIGVYAGVSMSGYMFNLISHPNIIESLGEFQLSTGVNKDHLTTRVGYRLNLRGPCVTVQTACSSSLVAVHMACQSLLSGECDMVLAGGASLSTEFKSGYLYRPGLIASPDGHTRPFDAMAVGSVFGDAVGVVVLRRLEDAVFDGDIIHAVIRGSAVNNDGAMKVGFTAPSVDGQSEVIVEAMNIARVEPDSISYVETHGTGTPLGDLIEMTALTQAYRAATDRTGFCAIGSVKANVGHTDAAAGVVGLIKTALALKHRLIPPSLHFDQPNPNIDFGASPFFVNTKLRKWEQNGAGPRRAGVSSFGIGGTNAHVILEEWIAPAEQRTDNGESKLIVLSARTETALETMTDNFARDMSEHEMSLDDLAYRLHVGRREFAHRRMVVADSVADAVHALESRDARRVLTANVGVEAREVVMMFPGQGVQYVGMGEQLYEREQVFREEVDRCAEILTRHIGVDIRDVLYPRNAKTTARPASQGIDLRRMLGRDGPREEKEINRTGIAQPALFVVEYALAKMWMGLGVKVCGFVGYSLGEYVAACLAGVFSLEDALGLVAKRAQMIEALDEGAMLAVPLLEEEVSELLGEDLSVVAINGPMQCVLGGRKERIQELEQELRSRNIASRRVETGHAVHSKMMDPIMDQFRQLMSTVRLAPPAMRYLSNLTGEWVTLEEATDPEKWVQHLRWPVRFDEACRKLWQEQGQILLEVGPGQTLGSLALQHPDSDACADRVVLASLPHEYDRRPERAFMLATAGQLWLSGAHIDLQKLHGDGRRRNVPLPPYPYERQRYWINPRPVATGNAGQSPAAKKDVSEWFYVRSWKRTVLPLARLQHAEQKPCWLVFTNGDEWADKLLAQLGEDACDLFTVRAAEEFTHFDEHTYNVNPRRSEDYEALVGQLLAAGKTPRKIIHLWGVTTGDSQSSIPDSFEAAQYRGYYSLLYLAQSLKKHEVDSAIRFEVVTNNAQRVAGETLIQPEKATVFGPCRVIPQEHGNIVCRGIDIKLPATPGWEEDRLRNQLVDEFTSDDADDFIAYRDGDRWVQTFEPAFLERSEDMPPRLRHGGVYLIAGNMNEFGMAVARYLAQTASAKIVLTDCHAFPAREQWPELLSQSEGESSALIRTIHQLEESGAEFIISEARCADEQQMETLVTNLYERFGRIDGVVYVRNILEENPCRLVATDHGDTVCNFAEVARELSLLEKILQKGRLDFCFIQSTRASMAGGAGNASLSAVSNLIDSYAHAHNLKHPVTWTSINCDYELENVQQAFRGLLSAGAMSQIVVSAGHPRARFGPGTDADSTETVKVTEAAVYVRPNIRTKYVAPETEAEQKVAEIWQEILGIEKVGVHDHFFDLGGHSLLGTRLITRLCDTFQIDLPLATLFESPTVAELALAIEDILIAELEELDA